MTEKTSSLMGCSRRDLTRSCRSRQGGYSLNRNGSVIPLIAILLPIFCVFIALAVDTGLISVGKHELQNAADAGAVAAIETYFKNIEYGDEAAHEVINNSYLLGANIEFDVGESIEYGTWDSDSDTFTQIPRTATAGKNDVSGSSIPPGADAVRVTLRRSPDTQNGIGLVFGPVFGADFATVEASAIASASPS